MHSGTNLLLLLVMGKGLLLKMHMPLPTASSSVCFNQPCSSCILHQVSGAGSRFAFSSLFARPASP